MLLKVSCASAPGPSDTSMMFPTSGIGRSALSRQDCNIPLQSSFLLGFPLSSSVAIRLSRFSLLVESRPLVRWSTRRKKRLTILRRRAIPHGSMLGTMFSSAPSSRHGNNENSFKSSCSNRGGAQMSIDHGPWEDALDSFVVDVVGADARPLNVPLLAPFTIATTSLEAVQNVAIRVALRDGSVGWGESPILPTVTVEDQPLALAKASQICEVLTTQRRPRPGLILRELLLQISHHLPGHNLASVRAGMEMAVLDAVAQSLNLPLWKFFGGHCRTITTDITIPICPPDEAEMLAAQYARRGFGTIKTKVGGRSLPADITLLKAIRKGHPSCSFIVDANGGYTAEHALQVLGELHDLGLTPALFEQPVARNDWTGLRNVSRIARDRYGVLVAADESCRDIHDVNLIIERRLAQVVNVKLAKMGVLEALEIVRMVRNAGLELMIGGMVETRLAMGFSAHFASGLGCFRFIDLDTPLLLAEDPVEGGYEVDGAMYSLSEDYGHGGSLR